MRNLEKRIAKLEEKRAAEVAAAQNLAARLQAGQDRVRKLWLQMGLPPDYDPDWGLPPKKVITTTGILGIMDRLNQGRDRARLRHIRDKAMAETGRLPEVWE